MLVDIGVLSIKNCAVWKYSPSYFFPFHLYTFSFSFLITLSRTSSTILNSNGENGYLCLVPDLTGKVTSLSRVSNVSTGSFVAALYLDMEKQTGSK